MTDNITPQAPQTKAPMTTSDIIRRLGEIKAVYPEALGNAIGEAETAAELEALTAAIQAVELLEEIKQDMHGYCEACKHEEKHTYEPPCCDCFSDEEGDHWEFRWPLGEEADQ